LPQRAAQFLTRFLESRDFSVVSLKIEVFEVDTFGVNREEVRTEMRMFYILALIFCLAIFYPSSTYAWDMCETSVETLDVAGEVTFTSSFCGCLDGDVIIIEITPTDPAVTIDRVEFTKATPHWQTNESWAEQAAVTPQTADVILHMVTAKTRTIHLWVYLSTGEHIGVNAHF
jgi:hypothetical protein